MPSAHKTPGRLRRASRDTEFFRRLCLRPPEKGTERDQLWHQRAAQVRPGRTELASQNGKKTFEGFWRRNSHDWLEPHLFAVNQPQSVRSSNMKIHTCIQTLVLFAAALSSVAQDPTLPRPIGNAHRGETLFTRGFPSVHDNGRSCATCHVPEEAFQLTPQHVEARFQALGQRRLTNPSADDPLFRSIDANDFADDFTNLRNHALVRVFITLPTDAAGQKLMWPVNDPTATVVAVWRSTPTVWNTAFTAPYQLDGRQPTLQAQALGALVAHAEITREPKERFLDDVAAFQSAQFSSPAVKLLSIALATGQTPPPTDPPLNLLEQRGKVLFDRTAPLVTAGPPRRCRSLSSRPGFAIFISPNRCLRLVLICPLRRLRLRPGFGRSGCRDKLPRW